MSQTLDATQTSQQLKDIFRAGWSNEDRVDFWVDRVPCGEFDFAPSREAWRAALSEAAKSVLGDQAADMGTGPGTIAQLWAELGFGTRGMDFSPTMLDRARALARTRKLGIDFIEEDVEQPDFHHPRFDVISSRLVLFTLPHPGYTLRRWAKLLRPGGVMVLVGEQRKEESSGRESPMRAKSKWQADETYQSALKQLSFVQHSPETLSIVMEAAGLMDIHRITMDEVIAARNEYERQAPGGAMSMAPYILVGRREETS